MIAKKADAAAAQMEALGWEVDFYEDETLTLIATRDGGERVELTWRGNSLAGGFWMGPDGPEQIASVPEALKRMAAPSASQLGSVSPAEALRLLDGRTVYWSNSISGAPEEATLPRQGRQTAIVGGQVHFASVDGGFRSVRLDAITKVS